MAANQQNIRYLYNPPNVVVYPKLWEAGSVSYTELIDKLIQLALERFKNEQKLKTSYESEKGTFEFLDLWYNLFMRNRDYKNFTKGHIYHIYNRGNNKEIVFRGEQDYRAFLFRLGLAFGIKTDDLNRCDITKSLKSKIRVIGLKPNYFKLHAFCLMPNHLHLLIEQCSNESISILLLKVFTSFAKYINSKYKRVGHVFQDQFKSVQIETNPQLMLISSYVHMNPIKDSIVNKPENYKWSSYVDFISNRNNPIIHTKFLIEIFGNKNNFIKENIRLYEKTISKVPFEFLDMWCN